VGLFIESNNKNHMTNKPTRGYIVNIEKETVENTDYRRVLFTANNIQLVLMNLQKGEELGEEVHHLDQFIRVEEGEGTVELDGEVFALPSDHAVIIPKGVKHNVINTGASELKLYSLYAPPEHKDKIVEHTKADVIEEEFDGVVSSEAN
jgi:mannose-6-phosphate isomerase-like protein (cupin superfamily)